VAESRFSKVGGRNIGKNEGEPARRLLCRYGGGGKGSIFTRGRKKKDVPIRFYLDPGVKRYRWKAFILHDEERDKRDSNSIT